MTINLQARRGLTALAVGLGVALGLTAGATPAHAHDPSSTLLSVEGTAQPGEPTSEVTLTALVPLYRYDFAYGTDLNDDPAASVPAAEEELGDQVLDGLVVESAEAGGAWEEELVALEHRVVDGVDYLDVTVATATDTPSAGVELTWTFVSDELHSHRVLVVTADRAADALAADNVAEEDLLGVLTTGEPTLRVDAVAGAGAAFTAFLGVGFEHFREGPDHLLFLCLLALAVARRREDVAATGKRLLALTVTFTIGHSVSLAASTAGLVAPPSAWVETAIAISIVLAAVHALRPRLELRREIALTAFVGLIHGLGFAGTLADLSVGGTASITALLGFNTGLELAQLFGLALVIGPLVIIARSSRATTGVAAAIAGVAIVWIGERALGLSDPLAPAVQFFAGSPERLALTLAAVAIATWATTRRRPAEAEPPTSDRNHHDTLLENR